MLSVIHQMLQITRGRAAAKESLNLVRHEAAALFNYYATSVVAAIAERFWCTTQRIQSGMKSDASHFRTTVVKFVDYFWTFQKGMTIF